MRQPGFSQSIKVIRRRALAAVSSFALAVAGTAVLQPAAVAVEAQDPPGAEVVTAAERAAVAYRERQIARLMDDGRTAGEIARILGLTIVPGAEDEMELDSVGSDVSVGRPTMYFDDANQSFTVTARYSWKSTAWMNDCPFTGNCGPTDAHSIATSKSVVPISAFSRFCDKNNNNCTSGWSKVENDRGVVREYQDSAVGSSYRGYQGYAMFSFRPKPGQSGTCHIFFPKKAHTWESTIIQSVTISTSGWSFTFSKATHKWDSAGPSASIWC
jgi:hypothetical protein